MAGQPASPIDITPPRLNSASPQNHTSNLTFALREAGAAGSQQDNQASATASTANANDFLDARPSIGGRHGSISSNSFYGSGARPILMDRPRRESNNMGSFAGGMSWGGVSVGSWIRDDIMMAGTSPAQFGNSPSFHSSSYLPKMEANFMKDFTCCGLTLDSLHDLLQHFEEVHANAPASRPSVSGRAGQSGLPPTSGAPAGSSSTGQLLPQGAPATNTQRGFQPPVRSGSAAGGPVGGFRPHRLGSDGFSRTNLSTVQDMDTLEDMEMDDVSNAFENLAPIDEAAPAPFTSQQQPSPFAQGQNQLQTSNAGLVNMQSHNNGLRVSPPTNPTSPQQFGLQSNPTVSSVNTPTLGTMSMYNTQNHTSPESSHPGTPAEIDMDYANAFNPPMLGMSGMDMAYSNVSFNNGTDGTIDQPGKRLFSKQGQGLTQQQLQQAYQNFQKMNAGDHTDVAKRLREQQLMNGANIPPLPFPEEVKPFRCPVIGCEKAYKNQNGLKYHKQHGHQNQQLKENEDGTFSIVDPLTSIPYPGTIGMEKEKPYRCDVCGKRYKNLNGLKYHRAHAPNCNPELKVPQMSNFPNNLQGLNNLSNVAGGMTGVDNMF